MPHAQLAQEMKKKKWLNANCWGTKASIGLFRFKVLNMSHVQPLHIGSEGVCV